MVNGQRGGRSQNGVFGNATIASFVLGRGMFNSDS